MVFVLRRVLGLILIIFGIAGIILPILPGVIPLLIGVEIAGWTMFLPSPLKRVRTSFLERLHRMRRRP